MAYELWDMWRTHPGAWGFSAMGYVKTLDCHRPHDFVSASGLNCGGDTGLALSVWNGVSMGLVLHVWNGQPQAGTGRKRVSERWERVSAQPARRYIPQPSFDPWADPYPNFSPAPMPTPSPIPHPNFNPDAAPIGQPMPAPAPVPWRYIPEQPDYRPDGTPQRGPQPGPVGDPGPIGQPQPLPVPEPVPGVRPLPVPVPVPLPYPQPGPNPQPGPVAPPVQVFPTPAPGRPNPAPKPSHAPRPPTRGEKESKMTVMGQGAPIVLWAINAASETGDAIDAIWWALPAKYRTPPTWNGERWVKAGAAQQARDLYQNYQHVNWEKAMKNLVANQVSDFVAGKMGRATGEASRRLGFGLEVGPAL